MPKKLTIGYSVAAMMLSKFKAADFNDPALLVAINYWQSFLK